MDRAVSLGVGCLLGRVVGLCREMKEVPGATLWEFPMAAGVVQQSCARSPSSASLSLRLSCEPCSGAASEHVLCYLSQPSEMWMDTGFLFLPK